MELVIRTQQDPVSVVKAAKSVIWSVDSEIPVSAISTMTELMSTSWAERRFNMILLGFFAALGLVLAGVGIYGLISYSVTRRTHEIGVRMALGAGRSHVLKLVIHEGMLVTAVGLAIGLAAACALTRVMATLLFGVRPIDLGTFGIVALLLGSSLGGNLHTVSPGNQSGSDGGFAIRVNARRKIGRRCERRVTAPCNLVETSRGVGSSSASGFYRRPGSASSPHRWRTESCRSPFLPVLVACHRTASAAEFVSASRPFPTRFR